MLLKVELTFLSNFLKYKMKDVSYYYHFSRIKHHLGTYQALHCQQRL